MRVKKINGGGKKEEEGKDKKKKRGRKKKKKKKNAVAFFSFRPFLLSFFSGFSYYYFCWPLKNNAKIAFVVAFCLPIVAAVVVALAGGVGEARAW